MPFCFCFVLSVLFSWVPPPPPLAHTRTTLPACTTLVRHIVHTPCWQSLADTCCAVHACFTLTNFTFHFLVKSVWWLPLAWNFESCKLGTPPCVGTILVFHMTGTLVRLALKFWWSRTYALCVRFVTHSLFRFINRNRLFSHKRSSMATKDAKCNWMATPDRELCPCTFDLRTSLSLLATRVVFSFFSYFFLWNAITSIVWVCLDHFRQSESRTHVIADAEDLVEWCVCTRTWSVDVCMESNHENFPVTESSCSGKKPEQGKKFLSLPWDLQWTCHHFSSWLSPTKLAVVDSVSFAWPHYIYIMQIMFKVLHSSLTCTQTYTTEPACENCTQKKNMQSTRLKKKKRTKNNNWAVQTTEKELVVKCVHHNIRKAQVRNRKQVEEWKKALL